MNENGGSPKGDLRASMLAAVEPIRANLADLNASIREHEDRLTEMRKLRTEAERVLKALDPDFDPGRGKPRPKPRTQKKNISDEKVDAVLGWLRTTIPPGQVFSVASIRHGEHGRFDAIPYGSLSFAFQELQERGAIRLDSIGKANRRNYALV